MSDYKIAGHCTLCGEECFQIIERWGENDRRPGEPKRLGVPHDGTQRVTFVLVDGTRADLTFCEDCAAILSPAHYTDIWRKVMRSWVREFEEKGEASRPGWFTKSYENGLLAEMGRQSVKELLGNG